jgi:chromosome segregation ATPase
MQPVKVHNLSFTFHPSDGGSIVSDPVLGRRRVPTPAVPVSITDVQFTDLTQQLAKQDARINMLVQTVSSLVQRVEVLTKENADCNARLASLGQNQDDVIDLVQSGHETQRQHVSIVDRQIQTYRQEMRNHGEQWERYHQQSIQVYSQNWKQAEEELRALKSFFSRQETSN